MEKKIIYKDSNNIKDEIYVNADKEVKKIVSVSDRELLRVIKEEKRFPIPFSRPVKLSLLVKYYNKYWNDEFTDNSGSESD